VSRAKDWEASVRPHFDFLIDHGFRFDNVEDRPWATSAVYLSPSLGVEVTSSNEFGRVEVAIARALDGRFPEVEVWLTDRRLDRVLFDNVLEARAPQLAEQLPSGLSKSEVQEQLRLWAELLRSVTPDFLEGDDAAILEAEQVIRTRVGNRPQELTIWLPHDASDADEAKARERAEETAPANVHVVVRRYKR
jgi:hypothetical protein